MVVAVERGPYGLGAAGVADHGRDGQEDGPGQRAGDATGPVRAAHRAFSVTGMGSAVIMVGSGTATASRWPSSYG